MVLTDWSDAFQHDQTYVEVARYDQPKKILGQTNPFSTVKKRSYYHFSCLNEVGLRDP